MDRERSSGNWQAILSAGGLVGDALVYALGYRQAADVLVEQVNEGHRYDGLIYPICFCYRHCIELLLKIAVKELVAPDTDEHRALLQGIDATHNLRTLCERYQQGLALWKETVDATESDAVMWFYRVDPNAETFRFATNTAGARFWPEEVHFDVNEVRKRAHVVIDLLLGTIAWVDEHKQTAAALEREYLLSSYGEPF